MMQPHRSTPISRDHSVATLRPFKGFRPTQEHATQVASKPYDVLSSDEAQSEAAGNPLSFLHVGKPEIDLPSDISPYDESVYQKGKKNLQKLIKDGILKEDPTPCFYLYGQSSGSHKQYGIVGCASVAEYLNTTIRKHELTRQDKEDDRTNHILATNAHTGPVFLTYRSMEQLDDIANAIRLGTPVIDFTADDGVRHQLWIISDREAIASISSAFKKVPFLYIADGHHRCAAAARAAKKRADTNARHTGEEEYNFFLAVIFPHNQVHIMGYNRVVKDLCGRSPGQLVEELKKRFDVKPEHAPVRPSTKGEFGMYLDKSWYRLRCNPEILANIDPVKRLDVSILQMQVLAPLLGIEDQRTSKRIDFVGGIRGLKELENRVDTGEMAVAFSLFPTSIEELLTVADAGHIMPPKSTWFEPKLRDGVVVHFLD